MKQIFLTLFAMLLTITAAAQSINEEDLVGIWVEYASDDPNELNVCIFNSDYTVNLAMTVMDEDFGKYVVYACKGRWTLNDNQLSFIPDVATLQFTVINGTDTEKASYQALLEDGKDIICENIMAGYGNMTVLSVTSKKLVYKFWDTETGSYVTSEMEKKENL